MVCDWDLPALLLTFSCAEYNSPNICAYFTQVLVNDIPNIYPISKLYAENSMSASKNFQKYNEFC